MQLSKPSRNIKLHNKWDGCCVCIFTCANPAYIFASPSMPLRILVASNHATVSQVYREDIRLGTDSGITLWFMSSGVLLDRKWLWNRKPGIVWVQVCKLEEKAAKIIYGKYCCIFMYKNIFIIVHSWILSLLIIM